MLTVYSILWGDKNPAYVHQLRSAVKKHLTIPHKFVCITNQKLPGIHTVPAINDWLGWRQKLALFFYARAPSLYFDLDVVITQNIDYLEDYTKYKLSATAEWDTSGFNLSVLAWDGTYHDPFLYFDNQKSGERYLQEMIGLDWVRIPNIGSYTFHCTKGLPDWMKVCVFEKLKPHQVDDPWILEHTRILRGAYGGN